MVLFKMLARVKTDPDAMCLVDGGHTKSLSSVLFQNFITYHSVSDYRLINLLKVL